MSQRSSVSNIKHTFVDALLVLEVIITGSGEETVLGHSVLTYVTEYDTLSVPPATVI